MHHAVGHYNFLLVFLSVAVALVSSFAAVDWTDRLLRQSRNSRLMGLCAFIFGLGIWAMHFIGMLAMDMGVLVTYQLPLLILSLLIPIIGSYAVLGMVTNPSRRTPAYLAAGGVMLAGSALAMHYSGMLAIEMPAAYRQTPGSIACSVLFALVPGLLIARLRKLPKRAYNLVSVRKMLCVLTVAGSLCGVHYSAMEGAEFLPVPQPTHNGRLPMLSDSLLGLMVGAAALVIIMLVVSLLYSDRNEILTALRFNERRYMAMFDCNPDMVVCIDPVSGKVVSVNPAVTALTGYSKEELQELQTSVLAGEEDRARMSLAVQSASQGKPGKTEVVIRNKQGGRVYLSASVFPLETDSVRHVYMMAKDVSDVVSYQQELIAAKEKAEIAVRAKSDFLATVSHEIRTPLNGILGINQILRDKENTPEQQELLELQAKSDSALLRVINDILDLSYMEAGRAKLHPEPLAIRMLLHESVDLFQVLAHKKALQLTVKTDPAIPHRLIGDAARIRQILVNLIGNAMKFTDAGQVEVEARLSSIRNTDHVLEFTVRDTGIGIDPAKHAQLFQPFTQLDASTSRKYEGTGLGLAISKRLVDMMDGHIWGAPRADGGAEFGFILTLPADSPLPEKKQSNPAGGIQFPEPEAV